MSDKTNYPGRISRVNAPKSIFIPRFANFPQRSSYLNNRSYFHKISIKSNKKKELKLLSATTKLKAHLTIFHIYLVTGE
jgi:hypothetical protein